MAVEANGSIPTSLLPGTVLNVCVPRTKGIKFLINQKLQEYMAREEEEENEPGNTNQIMSGISSSNARISRNTNVNKNNSVVKKIKILPPAKVKANNQTTVKRRVKRKKKKHVQTQNLSIHEVEVTVHQNAEESSPGDVRNRDGNRIIEVADKNEVEVTVHQNAEESSPGDVRNRDENQIIEVADKNANILSKSPCRRPSTLVLEDSELSVIQDSPESNNAREKKSIEQRRKSSSPQLKTTDEKNKNTNGKPAKEVIVISSGPSSSSSSSASSSSSSSSSASSAESSDTAASADESDIRGHQTGPITQAIFKDKAYQGKANMRLSPASKTPTCKGITSDHIPKRQCDEESEESSPDVIMDSPDTQGKMRVPSLTPLSLFGKNLGTNHQDTPKRKEFSKKKTSVEYKIRKVQDEGSSAEDETISKASESCQPRSYKHSKSPATKVGTPNRTKNMKINDQAVSKELTKKEEILPDKGNGRFPAQPSAPCVEISPCSEAENSPYRGVTKTGSQTSKGKNICNKLSLSQKKTRSQLSQEKEGGGWIAPAHTNPQKKRHYSDSQEGFLQEAMEEAVNSTEEVDNNKSQKHQKSSDSRLPLFPSDSELDTPPSVSLLGMSLVQTGSADDAKTPSFDIFKNLKANMTSTQRDDEPQVGKRNHSDPDAVSSPKKKPSLCRTVVEETSSESRSLSVEEIPKKNSSTTVPEGGTDETPSPTCKRLNDDPENRCDSPHSSAASSSSTELLRPVGKTCLETVAFVLHSHFGSSLMESFEVLRKNSFNVLTTIQELQMLYPDVIEANTDDLTPEDSFL